MSERLISAKGEFVRLRGPGAARRSLIVQRSELNDRLPPSEFLIAPKILVITPRHFPIFSIRPPP